MFGSSVHQCISAHSGENTGVPRVTPSPAGSCHPCPTKRYLCAPAERESAKAFSLCTAASLHYCRLVLDIPPRIHNTRYDTHHLRTQTPKVAGIINAPAQSMKRFSTPGGGRRENPGARWEIPPFCTPHLYGYQSCHRELPSLSLACARTHTELPIVHRHSRDVFSKGRPQRATCYHTTLLHHLRCTHSRARVRAGGGEETGNQPEHLRAADGVARNAADPPPSPGHE